GLMAAGVHADEAPWRPVTPAPAAAAPAAAASLGRPVGLGRPVPFDAGVAPAAVASLSRPQPVGPADATLGGPALLDSSVLTASFSSAAGPRVVRAQAGEPARPMPEGLPQPKPLPTGPKDGGKAPQTTTDKVSPVPV